uniref:Reverse transcriptase domain-containing protein n=1 Tax=Trichogramma kaykai TaxID=54128 RepID=A0ABD2W9J0_9HYME
MDLFSMCETWLTPDIADGEVAIPGYSLIRCDRGLLAPLHSRNKWVQGGGVACYIRESLKFKILYAPRITTVGTPEFLAVELLLHGRPTLVVSVYSPEGIFPNNVLDFYHSVCHKYKRAIIAGDFNINMLSQEYDPSHLRELTVACGLSLIPSGPTNHTTTADTWIDLIFVDDATGVRDFQKSQVPFVDTHDLLFFEYFIGEISVVCKTITTRRFSNFNKDAFNSQLLEKLNSMPFPIVVAAQANLALHNFNTIITDLLDIHAPLGTVQRRRHPAPWFTRDLRDRCKARDRLHALSRRTGDVAMRARYREVRRALRRDIKHTREQHFLADLSACTDDARRWSYLRGLGLVPVEHGSPLEFFSSQELSRHYSSINNVHNLCSLEELQSIIDTLSPELESRFEFEPVSPAQMLAALRGMGRGARGRSIDGVSFSYLQHSLEIVAPYLATIFNAFMASDSYPTPWKRSTIVPLSKVARPASPSQTRPVANLPHMARACDTLLTQQISNYLENHELLSPRQSGFRPGYSTQSALIRITEDMWRAIED